MALDPRSLRVYVVTSSGGVPGRTHRDVAFAAVEGGATAVQLRAPELGDDELRDVAVEIAQRCARDGVLFVVNDRPDIARQTGAAGVHVGRDDAPLEARDIFGEGVLGISVDTPAEASVAVDAGADYLGVTVFATGTKSEARPLGLDGLRRIADTTDVPVVGIGGIDASNARDVLGAGATGVAVVSAVGAAGDPVEATRRLVDAIAAEVR
jgi:thiamine-phosphate pyrophosphorylase